MLLGRTGCALARPSTLPAASLRMRARNAMPPPRLHGGAMRRDAHNFAVGCDNARDMAAAVVQQYTRPCQTAAGSLPAATGLFESV